MSEYGFHSDDECLGLKIKITIYAVRKSFIGGLLHGDEMLSSFTDIQLRH